MPIQKRYLTKHLPDAHTYAIVDRAEDASQFTRAFVTAQVQAARDAMVRRPRHTLFPVQYVQQAGDHASWLDFLFERLVADGVAREHDLLLFMDNDAWPIASIDPLVERLRTHRVVSVMRTENSDNFPHPSFTLTTYGFWKKHDLKWALRVGRGAASRNDPGSYVLDYLKTRRIPWSPMLRSNAWNPDPIMFGLYDSIAYHHGIGSRRGVSVVHQRHGIPAARVEALKTLYFEKIQKDEFFYTPFMRPGPSSGAAIRVKTPPGPASATAFVPQRSSPGRKPRGGTVVARGPTHPPPPPRPFKAPIPASLSLQKSLPRTKANTNFNAPFRRPPPTGRGRGVVTTLSSRR